MKQVSSVCSSVSTTELTEHIKDNPHNCCIQLNQKHRYAEDTIQQTTLMQRLGHKNYHYVITSDQQTTEDPGPTMKVITNKNNVLFVCVCVCI